ncbi:MAG: hypothetical protein PVF27_09950 [Gemmatimonadales bacterium]|jgi:energy-coupling factor transport system substrate-specific component
MIRSSVRWLALGLAGGVLNVATAHLARTLAFPLLFEASGTVLIGVLGGFWPAVLAGVVSQSVLAIRGTEWLAFVPVHAAIAFYTVRAVREGWLHGPIRAVAAGGVIGLAAAVVSWPIAFALFGGILGAPLAPVRELLTSAGIPLRWAGYGARLIGEVLDKVVTVLLVVVALRLAGRGTGRPATDANATPPSEP